MKNRKVIRRLAVVLPRYGESLGGGAEALVKSLVDNRNFQAPLVEDVQVWTTCARDHRTWENHFPEGVSEIDGTEVRRFKVDERDLEQFVPAEIAMQAGERLSLEREMAWLANSVNSRALYEHIACNGNRFDAILFAPYLFATTFWGSLIYPERSILIPCLHDEHYAYLRSMRYMFSQVRGLIFNAVPELELAKRIYRLRNFEAKSAVVGMGFDLNPKPPEGRNVSALISEPFLLYSGRKERGKNLDLLIRCFAEFKAEHPEERLKLVIIGAGDIDFLSELPPDVIDLGFVSEEEKQWLFGASVALCNPSVNESFSIVLMESWLKQKPVIVHADCPVTRYHVVESGGGLYFRTSEEFKRVLERLLPGLGETNKDLATALGNNGRRYVEREYSWEQVCLRLRLAFEKFSLINPSSGTLEEALWVQNSG